MKTETLPSWRGKRFAGRVHSRGGPRCTDVKCGCAGVCGSKFRSSRDVTRLQHAFREPSLPTCPHRVPERQPSANTNTTCSKPPASRFSRHEARICGAQHSSDRLATSTSSRSSDRRRLRTVYVVLLVFPWGTADDLGTPSITVHRNPSKYS